MIKFLLDIGISPICKKWLSGLGFDSIHLSDRNLHTLSDSEINLIAKTESRVILTCDNDFGTILALNNSELSSVILFRVSNFQKIFSKNFKKYLKKCTISNWNPEY